MQVWRLKDASEMLAESGVKSKEARKFIFSSLDEIQSVRIAHVDMKSDIDSTEKLVDKVDRSEFVRLLKMMLSLSPEFRVTPDSALTHPFITLEHLAQWTHSRM